VKSIIDHHVDMNLFNDQLDFKKVRFAGSCVTLIVEELVKEKIEFDDVLNEFCGAPLALDSVMFNPKLYQ